MSEYIKNIIIIAEAGINHNGNIDTAKRMIDAAADAGADYVKFQTFKSENLVSSAAKMAAYQLKNKAESISDDQYTMLKALELDQAAHFDLINYCDRSAIRFLSTAFDHQSIDFLAGLDLDFFKIPSGEITNYPYLKKIAELKKPVVMSTGLSDLNDIDQALAVLLENGMDKNDITILHCNTEYPTPIEDVNLKAMLTIRDRFSVPVGYSDHTLGIEIPIAAAALGAKVIEKHFTLDRNLEGPDHKASLEPDELKKMVQAIRKIESALGDGIKKRSASEEKNVGIVRKSIHAQTDIKKGEIITEEMLIAKRPGNGISPMRWREIIGKKAIRNFKADEMIEL